MTKRKKGSNRTPVVPDTAIQPTPKDAMQTTQEPTPAPAFSAGTPVADILAPTGDHAGNESAALEALDGVLAESEGNGSDSPRADTARFDEPEPAVRPRRGRPPGARSRSTVDNGGKRSDRRSKAELAALVDQLERENASLQPSDGQAMAQVVPALHATFRVVGIMVSQMRGPHWQLLDDECKALAEAWAPPLAPYLVHSAETLKWAAAFGVTWTVIAPRLAKDREARPVEISPGVEVGTRASDT